MTGLLLLLGVACALPLVVIFTQPSTDLTVGSAAFHEVNQVMRLNAPKPSAANPTEVSIRAYDAACTQRLALLITVLIAAGTVLVVTLARALATEINPLSAFPALALYGASLTVALLAMRLTPKPNWNTPKGSGASHSREQAGLVMHKARLINYAIGLLIFSSPFVAWVAVDAYS